MDVPFSTGVGNISVVTNDEPSGKRVRAYADSVGSMPRLLDETARNGLPRWAAWTVAGAWLVAVLAAVGGYLATRSWLVVGVFLGLAFLITIGVANAASLLRRTRE